MAKKLLLFIFCICVYCGQSQAQDKLHHLVLFKLKAGVEKKDSRFLEAIKALNSLAAAIPQVLDLRAGENFSTRPVAVDYGLMVVLENESNLQAYLNHPAHLAAVRAWKEIADWTIADFWSPVSK